MDQVVDAEHLTEEVGPGRWDIVLTTELMEHVRDWRACMWEIAVALAPGGRLVLTTRSPGFKYHPYPEDHWRYTRDDMAAILAILDLRPEVLTDDHDPESPGVFVVAIKPESDWHPVPSALKSINLHQVKESTLGREVEVREEKVSGQKLCVAFPLYQTLSTPFFYNWLQMDKTPLAGVVAVDGSMPLPHKMDTLVQKAFEVCPDFDRLVVLEQDMVPPTNGFQRIATIGPEFDIVGSIYFKHESPHHVMAWMQVDKPKFSPLTRTVIEGMVAEPGLYKVDGVAMGFTSIARHVLEDWNPDVPMWEPIPPLIGHDLHFCEEAKKPQHGPNKDQAYTVWLDSGIGCGHLTLLPIGYPHFLEALSDPETEPKTWAEAAMWPAMLDSEDTSEKADAEPVHVG